MPILRERKKIPSEYVDQYLKMGGCVKIGSEIWYLAGKKLEIGMIQSVNEADDTITVIVKGGLLKLGPMDKILFIEPFYKIPKDLKR